MKRETLVEITEYVNTPVGQKIFTESLMPDIVEMVRVNILRALPPVSDDFDPEEDEPSLEPAWPHLQVYIYQTFVCACLAHVCIYYVPLYTHMVTYVRTRTPYVYIKSYTIHIDLYTPLIYTLHVIYRLYMSFSYVL